MKCGNPLVYIPCLQYPRNVQKMIITSQRTMPRSGSFDQKLLLQARK